MSSRARFNETLRLVEVRHAGPTAAADLTQAALDARQLALGHGCRHFLIDVVTIEPQFSYLDVFRLPEEIHEQLEHGPPVRVALLVAADQPHQQELATYYLEACRLAGWEVAMFVARASAEAWLAAG